MTLPRKISASTGPVNLISPGADTFDVHGHDHRADHDRKLTEAERGQLFRPQGHVRGAEVDSAGVEAKRSGERADRLVLESRTGRRILEPGVGSRKISAAREQVRYSRDHRESTG